jgi:hypothetical protein
MKYSYKDSTVFACVCVCVFVCVLVWRLEAAQRSLTSARQENQSLVEMSEMLKRHLETLRQQHETWEIRLMWITRPILPTGLCLMWPVSWLEKPVGIRSAPVAAVAGWLQQHALKVAISWAQKNWILITPMFIVLSGPISLCCISPVVSYVAQQLKLWVLAACCCFLASVTNFTLKAVLGADLFEGGLVGRGYWNAVVSCRDDFTCRLYRR